MLRHIAAAAIHVHMFFLSVRVSLRKKWSQEKSTENPSDILRFPFFIRDSLRAHRRYGPNFSLRAVFFSFCSAKKIQKFWAGNMCLSQHGAVSCRFAIHTQLLKKKSTLSHFLKLTLRAQLFLREKIKTKKKSGTFFKKPWASTRVLRKHDGPERARW